MDRFPLMIFRAPGKELVHGVMCETRVVQDEDELDDAAESGWRLTPAEAGAAADSVRNEAARAAHAAQLQREAEAAEEAARAIRAPLEAQIADLTEQLNTEQAAHAATKRQLATAQEQKAAGDGGQAKTSKAKA